MRSVIRPHFFTLTCASQDSDVVTGTSPMLASSPAADTTRAPGAKHEVRRCFGTDMYSPRLYGSWFQGGFVPCLALQYPAWLPLCSVPDCPAALLRRSNSLNPKP